METFQYPPDLFNLLVDTIPVLVKSKLDVVLFFKGAGVEQRFLSSFERKLKTDAASVKKYDIARAVLTSVNSSGDTMLATRREILKRVTQFEDFSSCWEKDRHKAMALVGQVQKIIQVKDSFTRMTQEKDAEKRKRQEERDLRIATEAKRRQVQDAVKNDLRSLFKETDAQKRGKALEGVLNRLFGCNGILVSEAITLKGSDGTGIIEQIDGVISLDGHFYLVEMKWWNTPLGVGEVAQHFVRVFSRAQSRGIIISASGFSEPAIAMCREHLSKAVFAFCNLEELVMLTERDGDLKELLREKVKAAIVHKNPLFEPQKQHTWT